MFGGKNSGWCYEFHADLSEDDNDGCYRIKIWDYAITYGSIKLGKLIYFRMIQKYQMDMEEILKQDGGKTPTRVVSPNMLLK